MEARKLSKEKELLTAVSCENIFIHCYSLLVVVIEAEKRGCTALKAVVSALQQPC